MADEKILPRDLVENPEPPTQSLAILDDGTNVFATSIEDIGDRIGAVRSVQAGLGISVDNTDPLNPVVTATEGGGDMFEAIYDPQGISNDAFARENHTGEQPISATTGLQVALDAPVDEPRLTRRLSARVGGLFDTVADLQSDTTLTYSNVSSGDIIEAQGFRYEVAANDADDWHVETQGGVKLKVLPVNGVLSAAAWGRAIDGSEDWFDVIEYLFNSDIEFYVPSGDYACTGSKTITGKKILGRFAVGARLLFEAPTSNNLIFDGCEGDIYNLTIAEDTVVGIYASILPKNCDGLRFHGLVTDGGKNLPVAFVDCDNCHVFGGLGIGYDVNRPFAWELIGCSNSAFHNCHISNFEGGIFLIGPGYKSGTAGYMTERDWADTLGMRAINCSVRGTEILGFDANGTVGAGFWGCTCKGILGGDGFQVKQSTNIPEETADLTFSNWIVDCTAEDCLVSVKSQQGTDLRIVNFMSVRSRSLAAWFNGTDRVSLIGMTVVDWGLQSDIHPNPNGIDNCAGVAFLAGSTRGYANDINFIIPDGSNPNTGNLGMVHIGASNCQVGKVTLTRGVGGGNLKRALTITSASSNSEILPGFRLGSATFFNENPIKDDAPNTMYPVEVMDTIDLAAALTHSIGMPQRGVVVGKVVAHGYSVSGSPTYSVGNIGAVTALVPTRAVPNGSEFLNPSTGSVATNIPISASCVSPGQGKLVVSVRGVPAV